MAKKKPTAKPAPGTKRGRKPDSKTPETASEQILSRVPPPPKYLGKPHAVEYWKRITPLLIEAKILTSGHLEALAALCDAWHEYRVNQDWILANPDSLTFATESGYVAEDPRVRLRNKALDTLQKMWAKFGLTPRALADLGKLTSPDNNMPSIIAFARAKYDDLE